MEPLERVRKRLEVTGVVQGVGFRPFVYQLAIRRGLGGWVLNDAEGVKIEVEGPWGAINRFVSDLQTETPRLARIADLRQAFVPPVGEGRFEIRESAGGEERRVLISADTNVCADCVREMFDPSDRRYRYPFINCTNCGPRYTIIEDIPYDRPKTTMRRFPMCEACRREYEDPGDRRFHAQPVACAECGPRLVLWDGEGRALKLGDPIAETARRLGEGQIVAVKGLGGFHLVADATNEKVVRELRRRKRREEKPFAVMSDDLESVSRYAEFDERERELLLGFRRPIVLLPKRVPELLAPGVAPKNGCYGVMLPYTPIQYLIFAARGFRALVMTSGNMTDEPICIGNEEALLRLGKIADAFLVHDRGIHARSDDSVTRVMAGRARVLRRARGYVPLPVVLRDAGPQVLAVGGELKSAVCLTKGRNAFLSQHIGDLKSEEALSFFEEVIAHLRRVLEIEPGIVAHDMHPDYESTRYACLCAMPAPPRGRQVQHAPVCVADATGRRDADRDATGRRRQARAMAGVERVAVQHHHAHIASVLAEAGEDGPVIGVALDGTGYGTDGTIWGGEFLIADLREFRRVGHLARMPLPGGDAAIEEPWRTAVAYLYATFGSEWEKVGIPFVERTDRSRAGVVVQMVEKGVNTPATSSAGRLFDAISSLLGVCDRNTHEGQAPMELEAAADEAVTGALPHEIREEDGMLLLEPRGFVRAAVERIRAGAGVDVVSAEFHNGLCAGVVEMCERIRGRERLKTVALSGGCFQNMLLFERVVAGLESRRFRVLTHELVPPNDGCIALGQAAVARG